MHCLYSCLIKGFRLTVQIVIRIYILNKKILMFPLRYLNEMAQKSCIVGLPVVPFNQNKVSDVCQYLQWLEDLLLKVFKKEVMFISIVSFNDK